MLSPEVEDIIQDSFHEAHERGHDLATVEHLAYALLEDDDIKHIDSNGVVLQAGDTVTLIKDLDVKGSSLVAKRGTAVRNIGLTSNPEHIEGRVDGQRIVILTKYVKK